MVDQAQNLRAAKRMTWRSKFPVALAGVVGSFFIARYFLYRPVEKKYPGDLAVPVERSGGGL